MYGTGIVEKKLGQSASDVDHMEANLNFRGYSPTQDLIVSGYYVARFSAWSPAETRIHSGCHIISGK